MIVVTRHAEEKLLAQCSRLKQDHTSWRAVYFFHGTTEEYYNREEVRLQVVANIVKQQVDDHSAVLYFCDGGDIALTVQGLDREHLENICRHLENAFPDDKGQRNAAMLFDLSVQLEQFTQLCEHKAVEVQEKQANRSRKSEMEGIPPIRVDEAYAKEILRKRPLRNNIHIQLVEDDAFTLTLIEKVLKNYTVIKTMDGADALETYMLNAPDIVFLDINLPHVNGHEILRAILDFDPDAFVVMLSGNSYMEDVSRAMKNGAKGFVTKPFPKEKLINYVNVYKAERKAG